MLPVDLARAVAVSQQAVCNYEDAGVLPTAPGHSWGLAEPPGFERSHGRA